MFWVHAQKNQSHWAVSFEHPQRLFWLRNNKNNNFQLHTLIWRPPYKVIWPKKHTCSNECILHEYFMGSLIALHFQSFQIRCEEKKKRYILLYNVYILFSTHSICFLWEIRKILLKYMLLSGSQILQTCMHDYLVIPGAKVFVPSLHALIF